MASSCNTVQQLKCVLVRDLEKPLNTRRAQDRQCLHIQNARLRKDSKAPIGIRSSPARGSLMSKCSVGICLTLWACGGSDFTILEERWQG